LANRRSAATWWLVDNADLLDTEETRQESLMESDGQQAERFVKGRTSSSRLIR
jgi:hypothetical protein